MEGGVWVGAGVVNGWCRWLGTGWCWSVTEIKFDHLQYLVQHCRDKKATFPNSLNPSHFKVMEDLKRLKGGKMTNSPNNYDLQLVGVRPVPSSPKAFKETPMNLIHQNTRVGRDRP
ncbi:hypothetical protein CK203_013208 [Vitis vinifera]|uniref:Uncharacterized protein n=1 Tax=Vitis vinifera TaxID=29760 RepID=A0A438JQD3_VITVI|nr:hypothetical protein CK203_013208 [Vitis vinifera]